LIDSTNLTLSAIPKNLIFDFDYTCNYICPSCRTELINTNKHHIVRPVNNQIVDSIKQLIIDEIEHQPITIRWCGGELFISEVYLELIEYIISTGKNNIKHIIQTNGSYLKSRKDFLDRVLPQIDQLRISFDAGTAETYRQVRVNGVWENLIENVKHVQAQIKCLGANTSVSADFVVQKLNYQEIPQFVQLCKELNIRPTFQRMWNWGTWPLETFKKNNVWSTEHPEYQELLTIFKQIKYNA
jgi:MoaA/NifB/PqqE/SkfB family radical SAM enzyme